MLNSIDSLPHWAHLPNCGAVKPSSFTRLPHCETRRKIESETDACLKQTGQWGADGPSVIKRFAPSCSVLESAVLRLQCLLRFWLASILALRVHSGCGGAHDRCSSQLKASRCAKTCGSTQARRNGESFSRPTCSAVRFGAQASD
eukprot:6979085-Prymnesium_polylepis.1